MSQALYTVSLYDTLGPDTTEYIINHSALAAVATSLNHIPTLLKLAPRCPTLKIVISLDPLTSGSELPGTSKADLLNELASEAGIQVIYIRDIEALGEANPRPYNVPQPEDIIIVNYTSGTTGPPKGVVLTHQNAVAAASASMTLVDMREGEVMCSYLPLAHIYERVSEAAALWAGSAIGYFHGNILELVDDFKLLRPTSLISVPRLYNRFGGAIKTATLEASGVTGALSRHVVSTKLWLRLRGVIVVSNSIYITILLSLILIIEAFSFQLLFKQVLFQSVLLSTYPIIDASLLLLEVIRNMIKPLIPCCIAPFFELLYNPA